MKAVQVHQFGGADVLQYEEIAPPQPRPDEVLIRVKAAGINPVDVLYREGKLSIPLPFIPGSDCAGIVEAVGREVRHVSVGDRVFAGSVEQGAYTELMKCRANLVFPLPRNMSYSQGAALFIPYFTAFRALVGYGRLQPGEVVLIHAATGGVGTAAVQIAKELGAEIIATGGSVEGRELLKTLGATHVVDHRQPDHYQAIMKLTGGKGIDVLIEIISGYFRSDLEVMAPFGRIVSVVGGMFELPVHELMHRDITLTGFEVFNTPDSDNQAVAEWLTCHLEKGSFQPVIREEFPMDCVSAAHKLLARPGAAGKLILLP